MTSFWCDIHFWWGCCYTWKKSIRSKTKGGVGPTNLIAWHCPFSIVLIKDWMLNKWKSERQPCVWSFSVAYTHPPNTQTISRLSVRYKAHKLNWSILQPYALYMGSCHKEYGDKSLRDGGRCSYYSFKIVGSRLQVMFVTNKKTIKNGI